MTMGQPWSAGILLPCCGAASLLPSACTAWQCSNAAATRAILVSCGDYQSLAYLFQIYLIGLLCLNGSESLNAFPLLNSPEVLFLTGDTGETLEKQIGLASWFWHIYLAGS